MNVAWNPNVIYSKTIRRCHPRLATRHSRFESKSFVDDGVDIRNVTHLFISERVASIGKQVIELSLESFVDGWIDCKVIKDVPQCCASCVA